MSKTWNGEYYANYSSDRGSRVWVDAVQYDFLSAGGGDRYSRALRNLSVGDRVWVLVNGKGFVGVGRVTAGAKPAAMFKVRGADGQIKPILGTRTQGQYLRQLVNDSRSCEYFVRMKWLDTVPVERGVWKEGFFSNQNVLCKPTSASWTFTIERLKETFSAFDSDLTFV